MIINLKSENDLSSFYILWEGSTNLEKKGNFGISHLVEHLQTKMIDHLQEDFDRDGVEWNLWTSSIPSRAVFAETTFSCEEANVDLNE